jgi:hypothetical protein
MTRKKRPVSRDSSVADFEIEILTLFYFRAIKSGLPFELSSENKSDKAFDDLSYKFKDRDNSGNCSRYLLQAKHKKNKILEKNFANNNDFSLKRYFISFFEHLRQAEDIKSSILFTNTGFKEQNIENVILEKLYEPNHILHPAKIFKFNKNSEFVINLKRNIIENIIKYSKIKQALDRNMLTETFDKFIELFILSVDNDDIESLIQKDFRQLASHNDSYEAASLFLNKMKDWFLDKKRSNLTLEKGDEFLI